MAFGWVGFGVTIARADVIDTYVFSSNAGYRNMATGDAAALSGTFSWDATTNMIVSSDIDLLGNDVSGSGRGPATCTDCTTGIYAANHFAIDLGSTALYSVFADSLSLGANDPLTLHRCHRTRHYRP